MPAATAAPEIAAVAPQSAAPDTPPAPAPLEATLAALGGGFDRDVGIVVRSIDSGWSAQHNGGLVLPQQSLSKLWVVAAMLDRVDAGELSLDDQITLTAADLSIFHQPIRKNILAQGRYTTTVADLMHRAMTQSDNTANDAVLNMVGGPEAVRAILADKGLDAIRFGPGERTMQSRIAGLPWRQSYAFTREGFFEARDLVPDAVRRSAFESYLADPVDGATPPAIATALARLARGELLSADNTERLIGILRQTQSGPNRLTAGLPEGWTIAHKTGTGQFWDGRQSGYNDVGLLFAPDGATYAVAVMIGETRRPTPERMEMMQSVVRAVGQYHTAARSLAPQI